MLLSVLLTLTVQLVLVAASTYVLFTGCFPPQLPEFYLAPSMKNAPQQLPSSDVSNRWNDTLSAPFKTNLFY